VVHKCTAVIELCCTSVLLLVTCSTYMNVGANMKDLAGKLDLDMTETFYHVEERKAWHQKYYLTDQERIDIGLLGDAPVLLMEAYLRLVHRKGVDMSDEAIAKVVGWHESKVKRARLKLVKGGWFTKNQQQFDGITRSHFYLARKAQEFNMKKMSHKMRGKI